MRQEGREGRVGGREREVRKSESGREGAVKQKGG